jgi:outer membrane protein assembly factor BamB
VLFAANGAGEHTTTQKLHQVQAIDPTTGKVVWTGAIGLHHWSSPIVDNGVVYMVDGNSGGFGSGTSGNLIAWSLG